MVQHVKRFYDEEPEKEWKRLGHPYTKFEFVTTCDLITNHFPSEGKVCDIGCGPGRYSIELLKRGYDVTMADLSGELLEIAKRNIQQEGFALPGKILCANACDLSELNSGEYDALLHLGPMYHLLSKDDRLTSLREAHRLLKKGGVGIVSFLNSWGILRYGVSRFPELFSNMSFLRGMLDEVTIPESFEGFTECFWSTPPRATDELEEAGFEVMTYIGCESFASGLKPVISQIHEDQPQVYGNILQFVRETCELDQFRSTAEHIHFVVRK